VARGPPERRGGLRALRHGSWSLRRRDGSTSLTGIYLDNFHDDLSPAVRKDLDDLSNGRHVLIHSGAGNGLTAYGTVVISHWKSAVTSHLKNVTRAERMEITHNMGQMDVGLALYVATTGDRTMERPKKERPVEELAPEEMGPAPWD